MGAAESNPFRSTADEAAEQKPANQFVLELGDACKKGDVKEYHRLWYNARAVRERRKPQYDIDLMADKVMEYIKFAFRHKQTVWRQEGIKAACTLLYLPEARKALKDSDFIGSVLLITLPDDDSDEDSSKDELAEEKQAEYQILAATTVQQMAAYGEFHYTLCCTAVLNFLCIVLYQVPRAVEIVTDTFVELAANEKNLIVLMEGSVGDILESFFKGVKFVKPPEQDIDEVEQWARNMRAFSHCANVLGTLIKYGHQCQVDIPTIFRVYAHALGLDDELEIAVERTDMPDNVQLLSMMARLFYWLCRRRAKDFESLLYSAAPQPLGPTTRGLDFVLKAMAEMWTRCIKTHFVLQSVKASGDSGTSYTREYEAFCVDDLDGTKKLEPDSDEVAVKVQNAERRLCYTNCTLWMLLPTPKLRWKLRDRGLSKLYLAFDLRSEKHFDYILSTVRHVVDVPQSQECHEFVSFFGQQLLCLVDDSLNSRSSSVEHAVLIALLDAISVLAMQRDMQSVLAKWNVFGKFSRVLAVSKGKGDTKAMELSVLRTLAEVSAHPGHRLSWVATSTGSATNGSTTHPPREEFTKQLQGKMGASDDNVKTIASLLLTIFQESKFRKDPEEIGSTFQSIFDWWQVNTTARFEEERDAHIECSDQSLREPVNTKPTRSLQELLKVAWLRKEANCALTSMETMKFCAPHECVLALSLFSRLALEPKFKRLFDHTTIEALLRCICVGIWAEAREAAATLANLMWLPDLREEHLVCWLKFDSPKCITVDASNVLLPLKYGSPRPVDIGKGMYKAYWGIQFEPGTCVTLHRYGLKTHAIPGTLTSASPSDTFANTARRPYEWLGTGPNERHFTLTCWFYWPPVTSTTFKTDKVLVQTCELGISQIYIDCETEPGKPVWTIVDDQRIRRPLQTPNLNPGWHMLALVSSTKDCKDNPFDGTKFFLDEWRCTLKNVWVTNEFYQVGNDTGDGGKKPFGLITDFRIYARALGDNEIKAIARATDESDHPDAIARTLAKMDAATILAQRLDVPDSAAECLRALGSLATLSGQRAKIFSVCGRRALQMLDSPLPMIQRQASRLVSNLS